MTPDLKWRALWIRFTTWLSSLILYLFGVFGFAWPFGILLAGWVTLKIRSGSDFDYARFALSMTGLVLLVLSCLRVWRAGWCVCLIIRVAFWGMS